MKHLCLNSIWLQISLRWSAIGCHSTSSISFSQKHLILYTSEKTLAKARRPSDSSQLFTSNRWGLLVFAIDWCTFPPELQLCDLSPHSHLSPWAVWLSKASHLFYISELACLLKSKSLYDQQFLSALSHPCTRKRLSCDICFDYLQASLAQRCKS